MVNIYVGNLPYGTTEQELIELFGVHGTVEKASIISDKETGRSRGFGFVEMPNDAEGKAAVAAINGQEIGGRKLTVNEARPRQGGGGGGYGGGGGGGGGYRGGGGGGYRGRDQA